jgi:hypothetical protein
MAAVTTAATGGDGSDPSGGLTPVVSAGHPPPPRTEDGALDEAADMVERLNERYMVAKDGGKAVVLEPGRDPVHAHRLVFDKLTFADFKGLWQNRRINCGTGANGKPIWRSVGEVWLGHPDRRQFIGGIVFDPTGQRARPDQLNLWRGWAVEPRPGDWSRLRDLIERVLCADDRTKSELLLSWIARMFQRPAEHGEVAVVIRGGEGTGKGTLARVLMRIAGQHALAVSDAKHLTGAFNSHLRDCVFLHADEAFFAGDPSHIDIAHCVGCVGRAGRNIMYANSFCRENARRRNCAYKKQRCFFKTVPTCVYCYFLPVTVDTVYIASKKPDFRGFSL